MPPTLVLVTVRPTARVPAAKGGDAAAAIGSVRERAGGIDDYAIFHHGHHSILWDAADRHSNGQAARREGRTRHRRERPGRRVDGVGGNVVGASIGNVRELAGGIDRHFIGIGARREGRTRHRRERAGRRVDGVGGNVVRAIIGNVRMQDSISKGGRLLFQGEAPKTGTFFPPTLIQTVNDDPKILTDEVFGPVLPIRVVNDDAEAMKIVNSSRYGLNASIYSSDFSRAYRLARSLEVGTVVINDTTRLRWDNLPFGGPKLSGIGRESVHDTMTEMTEAKVISYTLGGKN